MIISIHALREEGDEDVRVSRQRRSISIHALREEGDHFHKVRDGLIVISIHALREEGDQVRTAILDGMMQFLSTPSARRATTHPAASRYR